MTTENDNHPGYWLMLIAAGFVIIAGGAIETDSYRIAFIFIIAAVILAGIGHVAAESDRKDK